MQKDQWPEEAERKLIEVWADVLQRYSGAMIKKAKAQQAVEILHAYVDLPEEHQYSEEEVLSKINNYCSNYFQQQTQPGHSEALRKPRTEELSSAGVTAH